MAVATITYIALVFWDDQRNAGLPDYVFLGFAVLFLGEFSLRLWNAPSRLAYVRGHWLDAVTAIPLMGVLRGLRLLRLLRLAAVVRGLTQVDHLTGHRRDNFWFLGPALLLVWVGSAYIFWTLEKGKNETIHTFGDALYLSFTTATTFGYGAERPVTIEGHVMAGVLIFVGIGLVAYASGRLTAWFLHESGPYDQLHDDLAALRSEIAALHEAMRDLGRETSDAEEIEQKGRTTTD